MKKLIFTLAATLSLTGAIGAQGIYTETEVPVPPELAGGKIVTSQKAYKASGVESEMADLPVVGKTRALVGAFSIDNPTVGRKYFTRQGLTIADVPARKNFHLVQVMAVRKHGIRTIDSGSGAYYFLILRDDQGQLYSIGTPLLGGNRSDLFLDHVVAGKSEPLSYDVAKYFKKP